VVDESVLLFLLRDVRDTLRSFLPKLKKEPKQFLCAVSLANLTKGLRCLNQTKLALQAQTAFGF